ncbi:hypothetical protein Tco_1020820 [Tanacetum coccineum]
MFWSEILLFKRSYNNFADEKLDACLLASININELPPIDIIYFPNFVCNMGEGLRNKKKPTKTYEMTYDGEGPSLAINNPKTQEELTRDELEKILQICRFEFYENLKLDGESIIEEEIVGEQVIKEYKAIKE